MRLNSDSMSTANAAQLLEWIKHRRSIKPVDYDANRDVSREVLESLFEAAIQAPTHGLTEPWRFSVYQGASRVALAEELQRIYQNETPAEEFKSEKFQKLKDTPLLAPVVITIGMDRAVNGKISELEEIEAVACAVQNMHLYASTLGLGAYWSSPPAVLSDDFRDFVGLSSAGKVLGLFYVGWPKQGFQWPTGRRQPIDSKVRWMD